MRVAIVSGYGTEFPVTTSIHSSPPLPSRDILPSLFPLPCAEPESLGENQIESSPEALADDETGKLDEMVPKRTYITHK